MVMAGLMRLLSVRLAITEKAEAIALPVPEASNEKDSAQAA
jgi:hypothetical protein